MDISIPDNDIGAENLLELIYLGDTAGKRMHELAQSNSDHVLLAACPLGRIGATAACTNAKQGMENFDVFAAVDLDDDTSTGNTPTYYKDRFCKSPIRNSKIDHPHAIIIFWLNADNADGAAALLGAWREGHATNMQWAEDTQIGAEGHLLAKIVPCDHISNKFTDPSGAYPHLANDNAVCDYVGHGGRQFASEALRERERLCSVWPQNADEGPPSCSRGPAAVLIVANGGVCSGCSRNKCGRIPVKKKDNEAQDGTRCGPK